MELVGYLVQYFDIFALAASATFYTKACQNATLKHFTYSTYSIHETPFCVHKDKICASLVWR